MQARTSRGLVACSRAIRLASDASRRKFGMVRTRRAKFQPAAKPRRSSDLDVMSRGSDVVATTMSRWAVKNLIDPLTSYAYCFPGSKLSTSNQREALMRLSLIMTIAVLLLSAGGAWAKPITVPSTLSGVKKLCGGATSCKKADCAGNICSGRCTKLQCTITIYRTGPTRPTPPVHRGGSNR